VRAPLLAAPGAWLAAAEVSRAAEDSPAGVTLAGALLCGLTAYSLVLMLLDRSIITWIPAQVRRAIQADPA